jgi:hypothetical protein
MDPPKACVYVNAESFHVSHLIPDQKLSLYEKIFHIARLAFFISAPKIYFCISNAAIINNNNSSGGDRGAAAVARSLF